MEPAAVVRSAWDAFSAGDVEGVVRLFAPDAEWYVPDDVPGPSVYRGHDELRRLFISLQRFTDHHVAVTEVADMGAFVLAHGVVYAETEGEPVLDRVTVWRCRVEGDLIASVHAEALPAGARWPKHQGSVSER
jgi:ketosteroid isomerase-like protein